MTSFRAILIAGAVALSATSAYASGGHKDIILRDEGLGINHNVQPTAVPRTGVLENRTSQGVLAPYARGHLFEGRASVSGPAPSAYEPYSTWSRVPTSISKRDIATEGNGNK